MAERKSPPVPRARAADLPNDGGGQTFETIEPLLSIEDLRTAFGRSDRTLRRWIAVGHLKPIRIGGAVFFHPADIHALIAGRLRR